MDEVTLTQIEELLGQAQEHLDQMDASLALRRLTPWYARRERRHLEQMAGEYRAFAYAVLAAVEWLRAEA